MAKCRKCGCSFDKNDAEEQFDNAYRLFSYNCFKHTLCFNCSRDVIEEEEPGEYFDICERCGKTFDYAEESILFYENENNLSLTDMWDNEILCASCALDDLNEDILENEGDDWDDDDDDDDDN